LFKTKSRGGDKTNLYVFITPHVVENPAEAKAILDSKKVEIDKIKEGKIKMYEKSLDKTGQDSKE
jgi:general secretion pathway protein D